MPTERKQPLQDRLQPPLAEPPQDVGHLTIVIRPGRHSTRQTPLPPEQITISKEPVLPVAWRGGGGREPVGV